MDNITSETLEFIKDKLKEIISNSSDLNDKEKKIIKLRYGLEDNKPVKIKELSKIFNISPRKMKEEVDLVEKKIFNILKKDI